uniref:UBP-type domain-containing protein n=1 Tax=Aureoumbra lagunensis TaxID=44058 RepID=A0A7S3NME0_9STRA
MLARPAIVESSPAPVPAEEVIVTLDLDQIRTLRRMRQHNQQLNADAVEFVPGGWPEEYLPPETNNEGNATGEWTTVGGPRSVKKLLTQETNKSSQIKDGTIMSFVTGNPALGQAALRVGKARLTGPITTDIFDDTPSTTCLAMLGVPSRLIASDLLQVLAPWRDCIRHIRVARHCEPPAWPSALTFVLLRLESISAAERLYQSIQGRCFHAREPARCQLAYVDGLAWSKLADESLLPPKDNEKSLTLPRDTWFCPDSFNDSQLWGASSTEKISKTTTDLCEFDQEIIDNNHQHKDSCVVCLEKLFIIDEPGAGWGKSSSSTNQRTGSPQPGSTQLQLFTTACDHTFHTDCLSKWRDAPCPVCRYDHLGAQSALAACCDDCDVSDGLWLCLLCGHCGCEAHHALEHFEISSHGYAMHTDTRHVWDFSGEGFVHRLALERAAIRSIDSFHNITDHDKKVPYNKIRQDDEKKTAASNDQDEDECIDNISGLSYHMSRRPAYPSFFLRGKSLDKQYASSTINMTEDNQHQVGKLEGLAVEFNELLRSQLARQREIYELRIRQLREKPLSPEQQQRMHALRRRRKQIDAKRAKLQAKLNAVQEELIFQDELNKTLEIDVATSEETKIKAQQELEQATEIAKCLEAKFKQRIDELMLKLDENLGSSYGAQESTSSTSPLAHEESKHDQVHSQESQQKKYPSNANDDPVSASNLARGEFQILYRN